ncbi:helix-turn-helix domain-containing protein [Kitasatospora sp. NPDC048540]|uniref:AraC family transcriptional regulator n=1 Tax=Kitasatospora sp. NPDC048540 TaxID=3155634 RepID=UPI0033C1B736
MGEVDESRRARPAEQLRPYVARYSGYRQYGLAPARHRGLPSPWLTFILTLDEPLTVAAHPDPRQPGADYDTLLGGLHTTPALITHQGSQSGIQLALDPLGARALLGMPAGELARLDLSAGEVLGPAAAELRERVLAAPDWPGRFAVLDTLLPTLCREVRGPAPEVRRAWRLLTASGGALPVGELAREVGWSRRHLLARFRQETGLSPKEAARVIRFDRARRLLAAAPATALADLAAATGYFDQAHLAREFRALAGCPPSVWLAEEAGPARPADPAPARRSAAARAAFPHAATAR